MDNSEKISLLDKSIILALYPTLAYFLIYIYEYGYLKVFEIPVEFINIKMSTFINMIPILFPKIIFIVLIWSLVSNIIFVKDLENPIKWQVYEVLKMCFFLGTIAFFDYNIKASIVKLIEAMIFLFSFYFISPLITSSNVKGYRNKLLAQINTNNQLFDTTLKWHQIKKLGHINVKFIIYILFISLIMFNAGMAEAMTKTNYYKVNDNVVIRIYNDVIICCEYDSKSKKIDDSSFKVLQKNNIDNLKFEEIVLNSKASEIKK